MESYNLIIYLKHLIREEITLHSNPFGMKHIYLCLIFISAFTWNSYGQINFFTTDINDNLTDQQVADLTCGDTLRSFFNFGLSTSTDYDGPTTIIYQIDLKNVIPDTIFLSGGWTGAFDIRYEKTESKDASEVKSSFILTQKQGAVLTGVGDNPLTDPFRGLAVIEIPLTVAIDKRFSEDVVTIEVDFIQIPIEDSGNGTQDNAQDIQYDGMCSGTIVPVEFVSFEASPSGSDVALQWVTATEINSSHYVVERSTDGGTSFAPIGNVPAAGNSTALLDYTFIDEHPTHGINYYRLHQWDLDGATSYSSIRNVRLTHDHLDKKVAVFPNPARDVLFFDLSSDNAHPYIVQLIDAHGRLVKEQNAEENSHLGRIDLSSLAGGLYFIKIISDKGVLTEPIKVTK